MKLARKLAQSVDNVSMILNVIVNSENPMQHFNLDRMKTKSYARSYTT